MIPAPASVIIVSRGRPDHLKLCLTALTRQDHPCFEVVLIADPAGLAQRPDLPLKRVGFDRANISDARNLGIAQASGQIIAFIDDDSVAEPTWLSRLTAPFAAPDVIAATGWTRDRDGFRWQDRAARMTAAGFPVTLDVPPGETMLLAPDNGAPVSTLGTNCAFRAEVLREIGGFDPIYAYHLDESDLNMRMAQARPEALTAIVPLAQVIHARAGSAQRDAGAVPMDLSVMGRSAALFTRRHGGPRPDRDITARTRRRLIRHMMDGQLDPQRVAPVMATLQDGLAAGHAAPLPLPPPARQDDPPGFLPLPTAPGPHVVLHGWQWQAQALRQQARAQTQAGQIVTVILLTPSLLPHRLRFIREGWFEQTGGLWGPSEPGDLAARPWRLRDRLDREIKLAQARRNLTVSSGVGAPRLSQDWELA